MTRRFPITRPLTPELKLIIWMTLAAILSLRLADADVDPDPMPVEMDGSVAVER